MQNGCSSLESELLIFIGFPPAVWHVSLKWHLMQSTNRWRRRSTEAEVTSQKGSSIAPRTNSTLHLSEKRFARMPTADLTALYKTHPLLSCFFFFPVSVFFSQFQPRSQTPPDVWCAGGVTSPVLEARSPSALNISWRRVFERSGWESASWARKPLGQSVRTWTKQQQHSSSGVSHNACITNFPSVCHK